jgi:hypothetical protein
MKRPEDFFTIYKQSAWDKDIKSMIGLYDDSVVIFDMWERGYQTGLTEWSIVIRDLVRFLRGRKGQGDI